MIPFFYISLHHMRYQGSKAKIAKEIIPIITKNLTSDRWYVEPFMGGCNTFSLVDTPNKIGNDFNKYVVEMWKAFQEGKKPISHLTEEEYYLMKDSYEHNLGKYEDWLIGYVGNACSYGSAWWNGYAKYNSKKKENHILEAYNGTMRQIRKFKYLAESKFTYGSYDEMVIPENSIIYCDPPYFSTKKYESDFDNYAFWDWCRKMKDMGHEIYMSEYSAPSDFKCIWQKERKDGMSVCKKGDKQATKIEKLFIL